MWYHMILDPIKDDALVKILSLQHLIYFSSKLQETQGGVRFRPETETKLVSQYGTAVKRVSGRTTSFPETETWVLRPKMRFRAVQPTFPH